MSDEIEHWKVSQKILEKHDFPSIESARKLIANQDEFIKQGRHKVLKWDTL